MNDLDTELFEVTTIHRVSFHDYFPDYKKLEAFIAGMGVLRTIDDLGPTIQTTVELTDEQFTHFCEFASKLRTKESD